MTLEELMLKSEAIIFASDKPLSETDISDLLLQTEGVEKENIEKLPSALSAIQDKYAQEHYPFEVKQIGGGYQFLSKKSFYPILSKLNGDKFRKRLSKAAMETLAIIAYRQPVMKSEIEFIRGVNSDYSVQKLLDLELVVISGRKEDAVGKPLLYSTSQSFVDYLGINSLEDLPKIQEINTYNEIIPTLAEEAIPEEKSHLVVSEQGEITEIKDATKEDNDEENEVSS